MEYKDLLKWGSNPLPSPASCYTCAPYAYKANDVTSGLIYSSQPSNYIAAFVRSSPLPNSVCIAGQNCLNSISGCLMWIAGAPWTGFDGQLVVAQYFTGTSPAPDTAQSSVWEKDFC